PEISTTAREVRVQRAASSEGPFADVTLAGLLPARDMRFVDEHAPAENSSYRLGIVGADGQVQWTAPVAVDAGATAGTPRLAPGALGREGIAIEYPLAPTAAPARLAIFDAAGRRLRLLEWNIESAGTHVRTWDRRDDDGARAARGVYFVQLATRGRA